MKNWHVEVHTRDRQAEHYIVQKVITRQEVQERIIEFYREKEITLAPDLETLSADIKLHYFIFGIKELEDEPVVYITGEYKSRFPL